MQRWSSVVATGLGVACLSAVGCVQEERFVGPSGVVAVAMTETTAPFIVGDETALYLVESRIEMPITPPEADEMAALQTPSAPFARLPWVRRGDLGVEIDWALTNLSDQRVAVSVTINGFNEFNEYVPGATIIRDEPIPDFAQWEWNIDLGPFETVSDTVREEELDEVAVDLATVVNGAPNANQIVYFDNHSEHDPRAAPYIPVVIPGLTGVRIGILSHAPLPLVLESSIRVRDFNDRLATVDEEPWVLPTPEPFTPVPIEL